MEQLAHELWANPAPLELQLGRKLADALAGPAQRRLRGASGRGLDQVFQIAQQRRVIRRALLAPSPMPSDPLMAPPRRRLDAGVDHRARQSCRSRCGTDATTP